VERESGKSTQLIFFPKPFYAYLKKFAYFAEKYAIARMMTSVSNLAISIQGYSNKHEAGEILLGN
jgi:hypothetical protein